MSVLAIAVVLAMLAPLLTRGSYTRLAEVRWPWAGLLALGCGIQIALDLVDLPEERMHDLGFGLLVASYVLILGWCSANLLKRGMSVVLLGVALNALVITLNQGMPVDVPPAWERDHPVEATVKHHPQEPDDRLVAIGDIIVLPPPFDTVLSFGDLILMVGLVDVTYHASRRPRRRVVRPPAPTPASLSLAPTPT